jgi:hypothetical protein
VENYDVPVRAHKLPCLDNVNYLAGLQTPMTELSVVS